MCTLSRAARIAASIVVALAALGTAAAQSAGRFDGVVTGLGDLPRLSNAKSRSISPENFTGEKGKGGMATEGTGKSGARDLGVGWKISPSVVIAARRDVHARGHRGAGRDPADLDDAAPAPGATRSSASTGTARRRRRSSAPSATSSPAAGAGYAQISSLAVCVNPGSAFNCYWDDALPRSAPHHAREHRREGDDALLPDQLHADRGPRRRGLLPRPVPPRQPAAVQGGLHASSTASRARATTSAPTWPGASTTTAGGARARSSSTWTATASSRRSAAPAPRTTSAARTTSRTGRRSSTRSSPRRTPGCRRSCGRTALYQSQQRFGLYRWHIMDPIRFEKDLRVTIQALGWRSGGRYLPLQDDIARSPSGTSASRTRRSRSCPAKDQLEVQ